MTDLRDQAAVDALRERFSDFFDAVLVSVVLELPRSAQDRAATLRVLAQTVEGSWHTIVFCVDRLREFKFFEGRTSYLVLSDGLDIHLVAGGTFLDLAPFSEQPASLDELRRSRQYVFGAACSFEVTEASG
jgi:hypothetical protein